MSTNCDADHKKVIKQSSGLHLRSCLLFQSYIRSLSGSLLRRTVWVCCGARGSAACACQFISSRSAARKPSSSGAAHMWGDYIFYLSLLRSIFPANSRLGCNQPRKPPCVCTFGCADYCYSSLSERTSSPDSVSLQRKHFPKPGNIGLLFWQESVL